MSQNRRQSKDMSHATAQPPSTTLSSTLTPSAGISHVLTYPPTSALTFSPQLVSTTVETLPHPPTFSFMTPSGQLFLSSPLPFSPTVPLPLLNTANLLPQLPNVGPSANFPYGVLTVPPSTNISLSQPLWPHNLPATTSKSLPLQSSEILQISPTTTSQNEESSTRHATSQPLLVGLSQQPSTSDKVPSSQFPEKAMSLQLESLPRKANHPPTSPLTTMPQKEGHIQTQEHTPLSSTASLKRLLAGEPSALRDPLKEQLRDEQDLTYVYKCFCAASEIKHLHFEVLPSQGDLKWLQVRQKDFHIDPELGPVVVARILVSSNRIVKFQILFPVHKTVFTKLFSEHETENILSELSIDHVICPGLPNYSDKFSVLGYHPSHIRILKACHVTRYDHEHCPIWHVPSGTFSKRDRTAQKMCKLCKYLQNSVVRLTTKACEVDPAERESWTDPSSNRPLAYMSAADREERYRKLRQERNQMLVKLRAYEERLGIGKVHYSGNSDK